jgi:hypothetical protein
MFYKIEISLIVILLILGSYEILQLTTLGDRWSCFSRLSIKWLYGLILTKKAMRNMYKYQHH